MSNVEIRSASAMELRTVLRLTLGLPGQSEADREALVSGFIHYARELSLDLSHQWLGLVDGRIASACTCIESPGRTAVMFLPAGAAKVARDVVMALISRAVEYESGRDAGLLQCLIEPDDMHNRLILGDAAFTELTTLLYLEWTAIESATPAFAPRPPDAPAALAGHAIDWITYEPGQHQAFADLITATYQDSLDCRGLSGLRRIEDIMLGHKSAGRFDPHRWQLLRCDGAAAGCILLGENPVRPALELVYMGVHPQFRRRGVGQYILQKGLLLARDEGFASVTLAVDAENAPALAMYRRAGFLQTHSRLAMIRPLHSNRETP
jgi:mycothiol synthase